LIASSTGVPFQKSTYFDWSPPAMKRASAFLMWSITNGW
jgi:hypothetical protein